MITSTSNNRIKNVILLMKKAKVRKEQGAFVVEGIRMVREAPVELVRELYVSESFLKKEENRQLLDQQLALAYEIVADDVFAKMSDTVTPQGVLCVVGQMSYKLSDMCKQQQGTYLMLEDIQDPGNLGTMIRTAEGAGAAGIIMSRGTADIYNPKTIRSTMGSIYRVPFCYVEDFQKTITDFNEMGMMTLAAHLEAKQYYDEISYQGRTVFLIGNEGNGLTEESSQRAGHKIKIPMEGKVESLNAAISATILMYEAYRQKADRSVK